MWLSRRGATEVVIGLVLVAGGSCSDSQCEDQAPMPARSGEFAIVRAAGADIRPELLGAIVVADEEQVVVSYESPNGQPRRAVYAVTGTRNDLP